ncbi:unnamed protein product [Clonostachys rosea]|uniref:6-methylsalicylate decarboxylase n=1 Tax=Bionectria ochroleuca TaxID=29856 RepID=A0ABY6TND4_BIOOC|nr:unnamed protein product [Clonostachys rosea]
MSKIDVHHHVYPPALTKAIEEAGGDPSGWYIPAWTLELDRDINASTGVGTAILSVTAPGPTIKSNPSEAAVLARTCNEYLARIRDEDPRGYGFFLSLPSLYDTNSCLDEIRYGFDVLKADGVIVFTRYGDGHTYLGSPVFRPVWSELNKRKAVVFIHPTHPVDTGLVNPALPQPMFDYPHETGRCAMDLIVGGTLQANPDCKIILSHAGGTLPYLIYRAAVMLPHTPVSVGLSTQEIVDIAREAFYFDTAISANSITLKALFAFAKPGRVLYGSDFPNAPKESIVEFEQGLQNFSHNLHPEEWKSVQFQAAQTLFPQFRNSQ